jgi:hypothetical protein
VRAVGLLRYRLYMRVYARYAILRLYIFDPAVALSSPNALYNASDVKFAFESIMLRLQPTEERRLLQSLPQPQVRHAWWRPPAHTWLTVRLKGRLPAPTRGSHTNPAEVAQRLRVPQRLLSRFGASEEVCARTSLCRPRPRVRACGQPDQTNKLKLPGICMSKNYRGRVDRMHLWSCVKVI